MEGSITILHRPYGKIVPTCKFICWKFYYTIFQNKSTKSKIARQEYQFYVNKAQILESLNLVVLKLKLFLARSHNFENGGVCLSNY